jgi:hypothetical protein
MGTGCVLSPAPYRPADWTSRPLESGPHTDPAGGPHLQVIITYGGLTSSHSAVRVVGPGDQVVFWDPAGDYGRWGIPLNPVYGPYPLGVDRSSDVIRRDPPDLQTYVRFRWGLDDTGVEVFEWDLPPEEADRLRVILLRGTDPSTGARFTTNTAPPFCATAVAAFLRRFVSPTSTLSGWYFFPHSLARALYAQRPSRVLVFLKDGSSVLWPSASTAGLGWPSPRWRAVPPARERAPWRG